MNNSILVAMMASGTFLIIAAAFGVFSTGVVAVKTEVESTPVAAQVVEAGEGENPNYGKNKDLDYIDLQCWVLFKHRPHGIKNISMGYGHTWLRVNRTKVVGADPNVIAFLELWGSKVVKPCSEQRDWTDCVCDHKTQVCSSEPIKKMYIGVMKGMQHALYGDPYELVRTSVMYASFEKHCKLGDNS